MKHRSKLSAALMAVALVASPAFAAGNHDHSPKHGGIVAEGKAFDVEFVGKAESLSLYVMDHGKPMSVKGAKAKVTLLNGTTKTEAELSPSGDGSKLETKGSFNIGKGTKAISVVTLSGKPPMTSRFEVK